MATLKFANIADDRIGFAAAGQPLDPMHSQCRFVGCRSVFFPTNRACRQSETQRDTRREDGVDFKARPIISGCAWVPVEIHVESFTLRSTP